MSPNMIIIILATNVELGLSKPSQPNLINTAEQCSYRRKTVVDWEASAIVNFTQELLQNTTVIQLKHTKQY